MAARLYNALTQRLETIQPARLRCLWREPGDSAASLEAMRWDAVLSALRASLAYLGFDIQGDAGPRGGADLHAGAEPPVSREGLWVKVGPVRYLSAEGPADIGQARAHGYEMSDLRFYCLGIHYRGPLAVSWEGLDRARGELQTLRQAAEKLRGGRLPASNAWGLAGYRKCFRDRLADDLDLPGALECLWDSLRPGALSPGSQLAMLKEAESIAKLGLF